MLRSRNSSFCSQLYRNAVNQLRLTDTNTIGFPEHFIEDDKLTVADWDLNKRSNDGLDWTALHMACFRSDARAVRLMIEHGANVHLRTKMGSTPLHIAAEHNCVEAVRVLLAAGADIEAQDKDAATPLHRAAVFDCVPAMKILIESGANPNVVDKMGRSPLHAAANVGQTEAVRLLLSISSDHATEKVVRACINILSTKPTSSYSTAIHTGMVHSSSQGSALLI